MTYDPEDPKSSIEEMVKKIKLDDEYPIIIGSSLGGWYAEQLTNYVVGDFIMYNPSTTPWVGLKKYGLCKEVLDQYESLNKNMNT